jgi:hypothetical protein
MERNYLTEFKKLEAELKKIAKLKDGSRFGDVLDKAASLHPFVNKDKNLILDLNGLRIELTPILLAKKLRIRLV